MDISLEDTICAIATPQGEGGVGIIRVSGPRAIDVVSPMIRARSGQSLHQFLSHKLYLCDILSSSSPSPGPSDESSSGLLDQALIVVMKSPKSYTGEDVVEIHSHGGAYVLQATCQELIRFGARLAKPGEFTQRAFLNGRLDLAQAEAVLDTIQATNAGSLRVAQELLRGSLSREVGRIREVLIHLLAHVEAGIDFVEEDIAFIGRDEVIRGCEETLVALNRLIQTFEHGQILREGVRAVIIGRPNVGKSSLLNFLLGTERAIVSKVPGTTRDVIDETANVHGMLVRLLDTAGLRHTDDVVESEGIRRTQDAISRGDVLVVVIDRSQSLTPEDKELLTRYSDRRLVVVLNKTDLPSRIDAAEVKQILPVSPGTSPFSGPNEPPVVQFVQVSTVTGEGMDDLLKAIRVICLGRSMESGHSVVVTRVRHRDALCKGKESVAKGLEAVKGGLPGECVALDIRCALDSLGEITGAVSTEDILDRVFRDFCIGK